MEERRRWKKEAEEKKKRERGTLKKRKTKKKTKKKHTHLALFFRLLARSLFRYPSVFSLFFMPGQQLATTTKTTHASLPDVYLLVHL